MIGYFCQLREFFLGKMWSEFFYYHLNTDSVCCVNSPQYLGGGDYVPPWIFPLWQPERVSPSAHAL